jgi:DNA-binding NarL/FixJ family response regulator
VDVDACPLCDGHPVVLVALRHPAMRRFTRELLARECRCWTPVEVRGGGSLRNELAAHAPDLLVIDAADFPSCCPASSSGFPPGRVVVLGPEPDRSYRQVAQARGAGAWVPRERVGEDLVRKMRRVLGCAHGPCPAVEPARVEVP